MEKRVRSELPPSPSPFFIQTPSHHPHSHTTYTPSSHPHTHSHYITLPPGLSCMATPPSRRSMRQTVVGDGGREWNVQTSRQATSDPDSIISPIPHFSPSPGIPKLVELEITRQRQPEALLSHLISPHPHFSHAAAAAAAAASTQTPSQASPLCTTEATFSPLTPSALMQSSFAPPALPPIQVPSRTDSRPVAVA